MKLNAPNACRIRLERVINLAAGESFVTNYCSTYTYRFLKALAYETQLNKHLGTILKAAFYIGCGAAAAGKLFGAAAVSTRSLFSPAFYALAYKFENNVSFYKDKKDLKAISAVDALILLIRKLAYLITCHSIERAALCPAFSTTISNALFYMKSCYIKRNGVGSEFSVGECREAFFAKIRSIIKSNKTISSKQTEFGYSKAARLKARILAIRVAASLKTFEFINDKKANAQALMFEARALTDEFASAGHDGVLGALFPPRGLGLGRCKSQRTEVAGVSHEKIQKGVERVLSGLSELKPGLLSSMARSEEKTELFRALTPIKRLDYYRETDDTYTAAGVIPKRRELLRKMRAARVDRKRAHDLFSATVAGDRENLLRLCTSIQNLKKKAKRFVAYNVSTYNQKLLNIVMISYTFVKALSAKIKSGRSVRADGRLIKTTIRRVKKLFSLSKHPASRDVRARGAALHLRNSVAAGL
ncbi:MAG TPA: hypothetical protein VEA37_01070 [Flavobacterium sp.]|nr:hypothetical protein [Flavobacterium sp.]